MFSTQLSQIAQSIKTSFLPKYHVGILTDYHLQFEDIAVGGDDMVFCFSDENGDFGWIEPSGGATYSEIKVLNTDCGKSMLKSCEFALFVQMYEPTAESLCSHLESVLLGFGATLVSSSCDSQAVITGKYKNIDKEAIKDHIVSLCDWSIVKIVFRLSETVSPYNPNCQSILTCKPC